MLILKLLLGIGISFFGICAVSQRLHKIQEKNDNERWQNRYEALKEHRITINDDFVEEISNLPQMTVDRFLNLYQVSPEKWSIKPINYGYYDHEWAVPYYTAIENGRPVYYPIFWINGQEMMKYQNWLEKTWSKGNSALNLQIREQYLKNLTKYIQEDIQKKREQSEKELAMLEEQFKQDREKSKKDSNSIELTLSNNTTH